MSGRRLGWLISAAAAIAVLYGLADFFNDWPGSSPQPIYITTTALVGISYLAAGVVAWHRRPSERTGLLFMIVAVTWFLPALTNLRSPVPFLVGNLVGSLYQASLAYIALAWPTGHLHSRILRTVVVAVFVLDVAENFASWLFWNPSTNGCSPGCPANLILVDGSNRVDDDIAVMVGIISVLATVVVVTLTIQKWRSARGYSRREMTPLIWVAVPVAAYIVIAGLVENFNVDIPNLAVFGIAPVVLILPPCAYLVGMIRARLARGAVGTALMDLEPGPPPERLRDTLAAALGDLTLQLAFRQPDGGYLDTAKRPVDVVGRDTGRGVTGIDPAGDAVLVYDERLRHEPQLVRVAVNVTSLALQHSRLQAEVNAQLEQVRASRARIVEAADTARRRLERDLHDGAQQRLVTLNLALGMARHRAAGADPELEALLDSASKEAREALVELRELARGIHPAVLTETGLNGALQALIERTPIATAVTALPAERFPASIEAAAYFVVCEALANVVKHAAADTAEIAIRRISDTLTIEVKDDGSGGAHPDNGSGLSGLADRVASIGGSLSIHSPPGDGTRIQATIPCP